MLATAEVIIDKGYPSTTRLSAITSRATSWPQRRAMSLSPWLRVSYKLPVELPVLPLLTREHTP